MKPNIVYLHSHDTGRYVQPYGFQVPTPNIQRLADQGVLFQEAFCAAPTCSGSRASLLTGLYCHNNGMFGLAHRGWKLNDYSQHIIHTSDGGVTWVKQFGGVGSAPYNRYPLNSVSFGDALHGVAVGGAGNIFSTSDGGATWTAIPPKTRFSLLSVEFVSDNNGWAVGRGGVILRTENAGADWIEQETGTKLNLYGLHFAKKIGWAVGADGTLLRYEQ